MMGLLRGFGEACARGVRAVARRAMQQRRLTDVGALLAALRSWRGRIVAEMVAVGSAAASIVVGWEVGRARLRSGGVGSGFLALRKTRRVRREMVMARARVRAGCSRR